jgi:ATP-binding cassette subfamily B (MDR/TAP) protein 1
MDYEPSIKYRNFQTTNPRTYEIQLKNVFFEFPSKKDSPVLKNISLKVEKNKVVALVGHSGCGKSTIMQLIQRYYDP